MLGCLLPLLLAALHVGCHGMEHGGSTLERKVEPGHSHSASGGSHGGGTSDVLQRLHAGFKHQLEGKAKAVARQHRLNTPLQCSQCLADAANPVFLPPGSIVADFEETVSHNRPGSSLVCSCLMAAEYECRQVQKRALQASPDPLLLRVRRLCAIRALARA